MLVLMLALAGAPLPEVTEGKLSTVVNDRTVDVPLAHTDVRIQVSAHLVDATVTQRFHNPYSEKIEALYLFPLPADAAVFAMEIRIGDRRIEGRSMRREKAERVYERAKKRGQVAALLAQNRPNLFKQAVANIEPNAEIEVTLRYVQALAEQDGGYELVFPMVAGPRYLPGGEKDAELQPAMLPPEMRSSHEISLAVELDAGLAIRGLASPSHFVDVDRAASRASVRISKRDVIPNKDFILRWSVASAEPELALLAHRERDLGSFLLIAEPPLDPSANAIAPRELIFVLDTSSSMRGAALAKGKALIHEALRGLRSDDTFAIVRFGDRAQSLGPEPLANDPRNLAIAGGWLDAIEAGGGTEMRTGLETALSLPHDPLRLRIVVFVTDGFIGNEEEVLALVGQQAGESRLFSFGIGSAVNRYLLEEMASLGRGVASVIRPDEETAPAVARFLAKIDRAVLTDLSIQWNGLEVEQVEPERLPDLFVGQPLSISGRYRHGGKSSIIVTGRQNGTPIRFALPVELPERSDRPAVASVWARRRIAELERKLLLRPDPEIVEEIVAIALEHRLVTRYTAFVAVDTSRVTEGGEAKLVPVPVEVPEGLSGSGLYGVGYGVGGGGSVVGGFGYASASFGAARTVSAPMLLQADAVSLAASLGRDDVGVEIKRQMNRFRFCYEKQLAKNPELQGKLTVRFSIDPKGAVTSVTADGLGDETVERCIADVVKSIRFPTSDGETEVSYPFIFVRPE